jgi:hypothetical protein
MAPSEVPDLSVVQIIKRLPGSLMSVPGNGYGPGLHALCLIKWGGLSGDGQTTSTFDQSRISEQSFDFRELDLGELERDVSAVLHRPGSTLLELVTASTDMNISADRVGDLSIGSQLGSVGPTD